MLGGCKVQKKTEKKKKPARRVGPNWGVDLSFVMLLLVSAAGLRSARLGSSFVV